MTKRTALIYSPPFPCQQFSANALRATRPTDVWSYLYGNYSAEALQGGQLKMGLYRYQAGRDFGNSMSVFPKGTDPFYNLQLLYLLAGQQRQKPPRACTTVQGPNGPETNCVD